jgi:predicted Rossmann fold flavoprotein
MDARQGTWVYIGMPIDISSSPNRPDLPVVVVGAGAAGLLAAITAARSGADVILVESSRDGGRKILISGGGRCNILPSVVEPSRYVTDSSPHTLRNILRSWPLSEQRAFFERELGMLLELEEETGKLFPSSHRARDVRDRLVQRAREAGVRIWFEARVVDLRREPGEFSWRVAFEAAPPVTARAVILATGGLSVPKTGSDGAGLRIAESLGLRLNPTYPALTPLTASPSPHAELAGVSLTVTITAPGSRPGFTTTGGFLFTHDGWSGPTVLDASHLAIRGRGEGGRQELHVAWTDHDETWWEGALRSGSTTVRGALGSAIPRRLADVLLREVAVDPSTPLAQLRREARRALVGALTAYPLPWTGDAGYRKAEVTGGGVALDQVDPRTLEARSCPGLHLCGEVLDAFGPIGGHNFLWAWATGRAAGQGVAVSQPVSR